MASGFKAVQRRVDGLKVAKDEGECDAGCFEAVAVQRLTSWTLHRWLLLLPQTYKLESVD
jgi:hypothetical protein